MSAPQVCTRCRKRRIRCDLHLPACKNCRLADVECFFWDNALGQEMPCSYLYSLRQRVATLKRDLETVEERSQRTQRTVSVSSTLEAAAAMTALADLSQGFHGRMDLLSPPQKEAKISGAYHLLRSTPLVTDESDGVENDSAAGAVPSQTAYLGPSSAVRLAETVLQTAVEWHATRGVPLPACLREADEAEEALRQSVPMSLQPGPQRQGMLTGGGTPSAPPPLIILHDPRKEAELHTLVPLATQRALLEHYSTVLGASSPCYDSLLPAEQEAALLQRAGSGCENPLKWASSHRGTAGAYATTVVFAVAAALAARDLKTAGDSGRMAALALRFRDEVQAIVDVEAKPPDDTTGNMSDNANLSGLERTRWTATALATLALCEMVQPTAGQLWELLGAAISVLADLREGYVLQRGAPDTDADFVRLERTLLRMEARSSLHFRRPSSFCEIQLGLSSRNDLTGSHTGFSRNEYEWQQLVEASFTPASSVVVDDLVVLRSLLQIRQQQETQPSSPDHILESLIPVPLQVLPPPVLSRARLADTAPLMSVQSATLYLALYPSPESVLSSRPGEVTMLPSRLFQIAAASAYVIIGEFHRQNGRHRIVSLWMSAERIVEAGIVWVLYILCHPQPPLDMGTAIRPILQVSSLLASFSTRWKAGRAYSDAWDALVELMWGMT
ncbi:hypothetical protein SEUCBS139899_002259 [Sporothrix eucalyptigena]|uniref:Zn(2)-C6 fungal-type domain-containing protein n=1 Tax=Sporothrix eucalyptigena TaxID=1812306 RepID=A0ABP0CFL0_9PEZI